MADFAIEGNMRALDGDLILALEDEANGFWIHSEGLLAIQARRLRRESRSPWVDGSSNDGSTIDSFEASVVIQVFGSTWAASETRYHALRAICRDLSEWLWEEVVEGISTTWRAGSVEVLTPPTSAADIASKSRTCTLTFPVQPTPTVTGI